MFISSSTRRLRTGSCALMLACIVAPCLAQAEGSAQGTLFDCVIEPQQIVRLATPVEGVIARLDVDRGDVVGKGQVLGRLESGVEEATLALAKARARNEHGINAAQARVEFLRAKEGRAGKLVARSFASEATAEEARAEARVAEEQLNEAKLNHEIAGLEVWRSEALLRQRTLYSPIDGVVVERLLVPGEYRNEQTPILTLAEMNPLRVEVLLPTALFGQIRVGSEATILPEPPVGGSHTGVVTVVDRVLDAASGTFGVRLKLPNPDFALPAGIRCRIDFQLQTAKVPGGALPATARTSAAP
jgi:RND family efflux transporter MFP subunit